MIGVIWNCQGLVKPGKFEFLKELITKHKVDFIGLQETKRKEFDQRWFEALNPQKNLSGFLLPLEVDLVGFWLELTLIFLISLVRTSASL
jgi:hypothetical protein